MNRVVVAGAVRTPVGLFEGALKNYKEQELCARVLKELVPKTGMDPAQVDEAIIGCAKQTSLPSNLARYAWLLAGLPQEIPAYTVHRQSASGIQAVANGYWAIKSGNARVIVAGGAESMTNIPREIHDARFNFDSGTRMVFDPIKQQQIGAQPAARYGELSMRASARAIAELYGFKAAEMEEYAESSLEKARAREKEDHIIPMEVRSGKLTRMFELDELAPAPTLEAPAADAAAVCVLALEERAKELRLPILAEISAFGISAGDPAGRGLIGIDALEKALKASGAVPKDIDILLTNEFFAAQSLALASEMEKRGLKEISKRMNPRGGSLAAGNPWGASGAVLLTDLVHSIGKNGVQTGAVLIHAEGGQAMAAIIRKYKA